MLAILSDIHANLEALQAVLDDVSRRAVSQILCLGDVVGYGPDPERCVALVRDFDCVLTGDVDQLVLQDKSGTPPRIQRLCRWARDRLSKESIDFLRGCPTRYDFGHHTCTHGSPVNHLAGYLFPEDVYNERRMRNVFEQFQGLYFCGHTHIAGIHTKTEYISPERVDYKYECDELHAVINVGSVGQPRDGDPRASYVLVDDRLAEFVRLDYDVSTTIRKLRDEGV